ncbi:hypothetical protein NUU61_002003 [Penicillium alfredii]|uniref:Uncharacterized protein n=1 Tax=Penicillium alfredii TaxID=1506179 RepID=A0A9W9KG84_9EURO|nr:uncharacterized protein NUU61_002003 [Penicillium alfredii]KAJ5104656.1 hypothetical protein NUU61_002003 [Penicillium alfredii]
MAGDDPEKNTPHSWGRPQQQGWPEDESNPFVTFRRFADEQVSSVLQSVTGLPSSVTPPPRDSWAIFTDDSGHKSILSQQRNGGEPSRERDYTQDRDAGDNPPGDSNDRVPSNRDKPPSQSSRSHWPEQEEMWRSQPRKKTSDFFGLDSFFDRFWLEDHLLPSSSRLFHPHHPFFLPEMFEDTDSPTWPIAYIMFSPYSPLHLERQAYYRAHREGGVFSSLMSSLRLDSDRDPSEPQWREAFEDLLRLENGKPMLDHEPSAVSKTENGKDWLHGLVKRGSLGDRWKYVSGADGQPWSGITFSGRADHDRPLPEKESAKRDEKRQLGAEQEDADVELDLYDRFLQDIEDREREFFRGASESPLLRFLLDERRRQQDELDQYQRSFPRVENEHGNENADSWLDLVSGGNRKTVPEDPRDSTPAVEAKQTEPTPPRVISTMTRKERVQHGDGSVQTKIVKTKRFADGREESDESVEVSHPHPQHEDGSSSETEKRSKNGWFWKD